jgi:hypothetical protein
LPGKDLKNCGSSVKREFQNPLSRRPTPLPLPLLRSTSPAPAVVRLNARLAADFMVGQGSDDGYRNPTTGIAAKTQPYYMGEYARLYPAFDGETPNGVKYGASMEIRQNSGGTGVNNAPANKVALLAIPCTGAVRRVM